MNTTEKIELVPIQSKTGTIYNSNVFRLDLVLTNNTVLSEEFQKLGGYIPFNDIELYDNWGHIIRGITVPPMPITYELEQTRVAILHPVAMRANVVATTLYSFRKKLKSYNNLQNAVYQYYITLANTIFGKSGIFNRLITGPRLKRSFRAVAVPGCYKKDPLGESYEWVGIPSKIANIIGIKEADIVVIGRDPTIWLGSVELLYAYIVPHDAIEIHPLILPQFAGDHDGDQFWGYLPPQESVNGTHVGAFTRRVSSWNKQFNLGEATSNVNWKSFFLDQRKRIRTGGISISPVEAITSNESISAISLYCGHGKRARGQVDHTRDLQKSASGIRLDEWKDITKTINTAQLAMKIFMGPVGLLALRLIALGHNRPDIIYETNILAERCAQGLLDAKHLTYDQAKNFAPSKLFDIINLKDKSLNTPEKILVAIQEIIPCDKTVLPVLAYLLKDGRGLSKLCQEDFPLFEGVTNTANISGNGYMPEFIFNDSHYNDEGIVSHAFYEALKCQKNSIKQINCTIKN